MYTSSQPTNVFREIGKKRLLDQKVNKTCLVNFFFLSCHIIQVFDKLREDKTDSVFANIIVLSGDVGEDDLGLSETDKTTVINNVNIIYHCAATLDFEADLPTNVNVNLLGTKRILQLCGQLENCEVR